MNNKTQRFKFSLPILKTSVEIRKDKDGNEKEIRFVEGIASSTDKDLHGDKMAPSAIQTMADSLKLHIISLNDEHNTSWQSDLGQLVELTATDDNRLRIKAELNEMSKSNDLWYALTTLNKKLGLSIGGYVKEYEMEKDEGEDGETTWMRVYKDIELDHIAVTSQPANPKTWVSVISKSIESSEENLKKIKKRVPASYNQEQTFKELAHQIVRNIQNMEADLLLEMTHVALSYLNDEQLELVERNLPMEKKKVSLEAEEAKKADAESSPESKAETSAKPDNGSSDDKSDKDKESKDEAGKADATDAAKSDEKKDEGASDKGDKADAKDDESKADESKDDSGKEEGTDGGEEDADAEKSDKSKSDKAEDSTILQAVADLTTSLSEMVAASEQMAEDNKTLVKRIEELESEPADRKTIEIKKSVGDDDSEEIDAKALTKKRDKEIAELKKTHANDPSLFSMIQRTRSKYASKIEQQQ